MEGPIGNLTTDAPGEANAGSLLGHLSYDKTNGGDDDFVDMPPLEDVSDHDRSSPRHRLFTPTSDTVKVSEPGMVRNSPVVMQVKGLESQLVVDSVTTPIDGHHVEVSATMVVPSPSLHTFPQKPKSLGNAKAPVTTSIDGHHVQISTIMVVPSPSRHTSPRKAKSLGDAKALLSDNDMLVLQNHFSSLDGLETTDAGGDPHTGTPIISTVVIEFNFEHITVENQVVSKFWANPNEMEEHDSDTREEIVYTKRKPGRQPKETGK